MIFIHLFKIKQKRTSNNSAVLDNLYELYINRFYATGFFLYPLKTSENLYDLNFTSSTAFIVYTVIYTVIYSLYGESSMPLQLNAVFTNIFLKRQAYINNSID